MKLRLFIFCIIFFCNKLQLTVCQHQQRNILSLYIFTICQIVLWTHEVHVYDNNNNEEIVSEVHLEFLLALNCINNLTISQYFKLIVDPGILQLFELY